MVRGRPSSGAVRRWPPLLWLPIYVASELILMGSDGRWGMLLAGAALALIAFGLSLRLALGGSTDRPRPRWLALAVGGVAGFYVLVAAAAATAGPEYAVAGLMAGVIPMTAVSLMVAALRSKTVESDEGLEDTAAADHEDPFPGMGIDDAAPLGDTSQHADLVEDVRRRASR
jgi:hypothetical protein